MPDTLDELGAAERGSAAGWPRGVGDERGAAGWPRGVGDERGAAGWPRGVGDGPTIACAGRIVKWSVVCVCVLGWATASAAPKAGVPATPAAPTPDTPGPPSPATPSPDPTTTRAASANDTVLPLLGALRRLTAPEPPPSAPPEVTTTEPPKKPVAGFEIRGDSKVQPVMLGYLTHLEIGQRVSVNDIPKIEQALVSCELFKKVEVSLEDAPDDPDRVTVVVTAVDKHSWIAAPTAFFLPGNTAFGVGYAENNFRGLGQKFLLYGQYGTRTSLILGVFLDPSYRGTKWTWRTDLYGFRRAIDEYTNPADDKQSFAVSRTTDASYLGAGALLGYNFLWWLAADLRLRGAYVYYRNARDADDQPLKLPEKDGWDVTLQSHFTIDHRHHRYGVTWGSYVQLTLEASVPGVDSYGYQIMLLRAYHSWRLFGEHELELRAHFNAGRHLPMHEEVTLGGVADLRGYDVDQFRGDLRAVGRIEYSVPLFRWRFLSFRGIGFYDTGFLDVQSPRDTRDYLPNQLAHSYRRSDVGTGLRVYLDNIVLPLLGLDLGYGIEGHSPEIYFEVGLTDF